MIMFAKQTKTFHCPLEPGARFTNVRKIRKNISTYEVRKNNLKIRKKCFTNAFVSFDRKLSNFVTYENNSVTTHAQLAFLLYFI